MRLFQCLILAAAAAGAAWAQSQNCNIAPATFTGTGTAQFNNRTNQCGRWTFTYYAQGFGSLSIEVDGAPDNGGTPGAWAAVASSGACTVSGGANPDTVTTSDTIVLTNCYFPWMRVNVTAVTGTGTIVARGYGIASASASSGGGSVGPPSPNATPVKLYIASTGADTNPCTSAQPCLTFARLQSLTPALLTSNYEWHVKDSATYSGASNGIDTRGYTGSSGTGLTVVGDAAAPTISGIVSAVSGCASGAIVCIMGNSRVYLNNLTLSGTSRDIIYVEMAELWLNSVTMTGDNTNTVDCIDASGARILQVGSITCGSMKAGGVGIYIAQMSNYILNTGTLTVACAGGAGNTQWAINTEFVSSMSIIPIGSPQAINVSGCQIGIGATGHSNFSAFVGGTISITNPVTPASSNGLYATNGSTIDQSGTTLTINNFTNCIFAIGVSEISQGPGNRTTTNCTVSNPVSGNTTYSASNQSSYVTLF